MKSLGKDVGLFYLKKKSGIQISSVVNCNLKKLLLDKFMNKNDFN